jgi:hypothetical protein
MKKTLSVMAVAAAAPSIALAAANATVTAGTQYSACDGGVAAKYDQYGGPGAVVTTTDTFVKVGFSVQCSANTFVRFNDVSTTQFLVGAGSSKGNQSFRGSSNGGAVVLNAQCTGTNQACTSTDASNAVTAASSM